MTHDEKEPWPAELIPDRARVFRRVHRTFLLGRAEKDEDGIPLGAIRKDVELSTDWSKYSTPEETRSRALKPEANGVISLPVGSIRRETQQTETVQTVEHAPEPNNRSHSLVVGRKDQETRVLLSRLARWEIRLTDEDEGGHRNL
jgi:hypothetical protein